MSPLYLYNGKLLVSEGKLATNNACCCSPPPTGCYGYVEILHVSRAEWTDFNINCNPPSMWETNVTIPNRFPVPAKINIVGNVNDDLILNGQSITTGWQYDPGPYFSIVPGCVGAHNIGDMPGNFQDLVNGGITIPMNQRNFTIALADTIGAGAGWDITISVCCENPNGCYEEATNSCCKETIGDPAMWPVGISYYNCESGEHITVENCDGIFKPNVKCTQNLCLPPQGACCVDGFCVGVISEAACNAVIGINKVWIEGETCDNNICAGCCCNQSYPYTTDKITCISSGHTWLNGIVCINALCSLSFVAETSIEFDGWDRTEIPNTSPSQSLYSINIPCSLVDSYIIPVYDNNNIRFIPLNWPENINIISSTIVGICDNPLP